ncbi:MAG: hypothetical protein ACREV8_05740, partial [Gammaproteobacteria bacterium]
MRNIRDVSPLKTLLLISGFFAAAIFAGVSAAPAESEPASPPAPATDSAPAAQKEGAPAPIPLAEIASQIESASARVRDLQSELASERIAETVAEQLPLLTREIDARLRESRRIIAQRPSVEILVGIDAEWRRLRRNLSAWIEDLTNRATHLEREIAGLDELGKTWEQTLEGARNSNAPPEVLRRIEAVITQIKQARQTIDKQRARVLTMQTRVALQDARVADALTSIRQAREDVLNRLFVRDSPAIWSAELRSRALQDVLEETRSSLATQWTTLSIYVERRSIRFFLHTTLFITLLAGLY